ncbi:MAG: hypothetical protein KY459_01550 [Acidobacteria bacterium]|nr:hypothetical protein [Acidobacteriota bacterium]
MLRLVPEIEQRGAGEQLVRIERREIFSIWSPLRFLMLAGVSLIVGAAAMWLAETPGETVHIIGIATVLLTSAICYGWATRRGSAEATVGEIVLLLGALLFSTAIAWIEIRYAVLGSRWSWHLLLLAAFHGATAYRFGSRAVMTVAIVSLAGWWGVERSGQFLSAGAFGAGGRLLAAAGSIAIWGLLDARLAAPSKFTPYFRGFAINLAFIGAICWIVSDEARWIGLAILIVLAAFAIVRARAGTRDEELFYAVVYGAIGLDALVLSEVQSEFATIWIALTSLVLVGFTVWFLSKRRSR